MDSKQRKLRKGPREPRTFKYPRWYWSSDADVELIEVYPDGQCYRTLAFTQMFVYKDIRGSTYVARPCWYREGMTAKQALRAMHKYAREHRFKREFVGEIK